MSRWHDVTAVGSAWEVESDPYTERYRHRPMPMSRLARTRFLDVDGPAEDWRPGPPPDRRD